MERYEDSMLVLRRTFPQGLQRFDRYMDSLHPHTGRKAAITQDQIERIRAMNQVDTELYEFAVGLFNARWASMLAQLSPEEARQRFRKKGKVYVLG